MATLRGQTIKLDIKPGPSGPNCPVCGQTLSWEGPGLWGCDICQQAVNGTTIEQVRAEVKDLARTFTAHFASAEGKRCTCGADSTMTARGPGVIIDSEVPQHRASCPLAPKGWRWPPIDEELRAWQDEATASQRAHALKAGERP